jgi:hypothetical protein
LLIHGLMEELMFAVLRQILAAIAPSLMKSPGKSQASNDNALPRDTLSAKREPIPFGKRGSKAAPKEEPALPEWKRSKQRLRR